MAHTLVPEDLTVIEREMKKIVNENLPVVRKEISREEARHIFAHDALKLELLEAIPAEELVTIYEQGEFTDLCRGPHVPSTNKLQHFKLMNISGAYWRGDSNKQMLQRIYGVAFATKEDMAEYFVFLEEAEKRNHRKLGKELELFMFSEEAPGMPFYLANGQIIRNELEGFLRGLQSSYDYKEVRTPLMMNQRLWEQSGHWQHYKENMYFTQVDEQKFVLKPMGELNVLKIFLIVTAFGFFLSIIAGSYKMFFAISLLIFLATSILRPVLTTLISKLAGNEQGFAMGMNNAYMSIGNVLGPLLAGALYDIRILFPFIAGLIILVLTTIFTFMWKGAKLQKSFN